VSRTRKKKSSRPAPPRPDPERPWIVGGVDYGPAIAAVADLAAWAFELAARDVEDWPEGRRRVRSARRDVLARIRGKRAARATTEDVLFTAGLLARIFEAELSLGMAEMVTILDELGLPTEVVPLMPRSQRSRGGRPASVVPLVPPERPAGAQPAPCCTGCVHHPRFRNAA
jgi:hypothetical protein